MTRRSQRSRRTTSATPPRAWRSARSERQSGAADAGRAKAPMTLDVYADLFDDDLDVVADRLDTAIIKTNTTSKPASMENAAD